MKFYTNHASLLLLLLPALTSAAAAPAAAQIDSELRAVSPSDDSTDSNSVNVGSRHGVPTRDAPVDGKDGKPHLGPFVESTVSSDSERELPRLKGRPNDPTIVDGQRIPETNDGVMFDKNREHPLEGTTGTEGGVTEKDRTRKDQELQVGGKIQTQPEAPKEQLPMPHSEELKIQSNEKGKDATKQVGSGSEDSNAYTGLDKPDDLPVKTQQDLPPLPNSANKDHLDVGGSKPSTSVAHADEDEEGIIQPFHSFILSFTMILVSEVGDKTFLVAALMAMKHDRMVVFTAAFGALLVMTVLSAVLGHAVPTLIPKRLTSFLAAILFFVFGAKLLREGMEMSPDEGVSAEMHEVEQELAQKEKEMGRYNGNNADPYALEMGLNRRRSRSRSRFPSPPRSPSQSRSRSPSRRSGAVNSIVHGASNLCSLLLSPAWVQTFVMTFLGEWGDRSQIATIAMAAGQDYWWVTLGAMGGHAICTSAAVIGGRAIAGRVSMKVVTIGGAVAFLIFGVIYFFEALYA